MDLAKKRGQTLVNLAVMACLAMAGAMIYANALVTPFVFDDTMIMKDPHLLFTEITPDRIAGLTRITTENVSPRLVPNLTFALNYYFGRRQVLGYHLVNLLIHIAAAGLVFLVCRHTMLLRRKPSFLIPVMAALLWLTNPLQVQSVTYIWQRMNSLSAFFFMLTLYCYIRARETGLSAGSHKTPAAIAFFTAAVLSGLLALASKQTSATLPLMLVLYEWFFFQDLRYAWVKRQLPWIGLAALAAAGLALFFLNAAPVKTVLSTYVDKPFTPVQRLLTEPQIILYYITLLLFPHPSRLNMDIAFPLSSALMSPAVTVSAIIALTVLIAGAAVMAKKNRLLSFAMIWFVANLVIESSVIGLDLIYGYRTYLPAIFLFMALTAAMFRVVRYKSAAIFLLSATIVISGLWTVQYNTVWRSNASFWKDITRKSPMSARAYNNLGLTYKNTGACDQAVAAFRQALRIRLATVGPDHYKTGETLNNLGVAYDCLGDVADAVDSYEKALRVFSRRFGPGHPRTAAVYNNLCVLYGRNENFDRAIFWCSKALNVREAALGPDHPEVADLHNNLGLALAGAGLWDEARRHLETALRIYQRHLGDHHPQTEQCRANLTHLLSRKKSVSPVPPARADQQ